MDWDRFTHYLEILLGVLIGALAVSLAVNISSSRKEKVPQPLPEWRKIDLVLESISRNYVDTIDYDGITQAAIEAVFEKLDPHSTYLPPVELTESETELAGNFDGIGIQFNVPNDTAIVLEVIPGGPSEKIGLRPGDRILKVDSINIAGVSYPQDSMVRHLKGPAGTKVNVLVGRDGTTVPFEITRGRIPVHSIDASFMVQDTIGYIRLSKFSRTTSLEFLKAATELKAQGMKSLVFDLRSNTGGYFDQALTLSNFFLEKGRDIVYMEGMRRDRDSYKADGKGFLTDIPLAVLIDEGSASSSEIFAGAMQDNDRGTIIGRRSFGKGLVQEPYYFSDGSGIRLTVARFYTPSGRCIQKPYSDDYAYEVYKRYGTGEMVAADSIKVDTTNVFKTVSGRTVYGGGGIIPDVFVPLDTTRIGQFYIQANSKATAMRFASFYFDLHKDELSAIDDYQDLLKYLDGASLERAFLDFALRKDGLKPTPSEWDIERHYMMTSVQALVGRYSKLGDKAFYHLYLQIDDVFDKALEILSAGR